MTDPSVDPYPLSVNGADHAVRTSWLGESLLYVLRERLGFPGSKNACDQGECGSCTVLMDGLPVCAFCTPGLIVATTDLLDRVPDADVPTIREALSGNLCRCTGYGRIIEAVGMVQTMRGTHEGEGAAPPPPG